MPFLLKIGPYPLYYYFLVKECGFLKTKVKYQQKEISTKGNINVQVSQCNTVTYPTSPHQIKSHFNRYIENMSLIW